MFIHDDLCIFLETETRITCIPISCTASSQIADIGIHTAHTQEKNTYYMNTKEFFRNVHHLQTFSTVHPEIRTKNHLTNQKKRIVAITINKTRAKYIHWNDAHSVYEIS